MHHQSPTHTPGITKAQVKLVSLEYATREYKRKMLTIVMKKPYAGDQHARQWRERDTIWSWDPTTENMSTTPIFFLLFKLIFHSSLMGKVNVAASRTILKAAAGHAREANLRHEPSCSPSHRCLEPSADVVDGNARGASHTRCN